MLDRFPSPSLAHRCWRPAADVYQTSDGWLIKLELAGVRPEDVRVEVRGRRLTICGQRLDHCTETNGCCQSLEISYDSFERTFDFPADLQSQATQLQFDAGMLLVRVRLAAA